LRKHGRISRGPLPHRAAAARLVFVRKIITEILLLLWKALRVVLWKWLRPLLGRIAVFAVLAVSLVVLIVMIVTRM
jgi:hypothetical protein